MKKIYPVIFTAADFGVLVAVPDWLNKEAEAAHLNVSKILQEALMSRLGVSK